MKEEDRAYGPFTRRLLNVERHSGMVKLDENTVSHKFGAAIRKILCSQVSFNLLLLYVKSENKNQTSC